MDDDRSRASVRYFELVNALGKQSGFKHGWKSEVARRLNVHPSYISKIAAGKVHTVGSDVIVKAIEALPIRTGFFFDEVDPEGQPPYWREYLLESPASERAPSRRLRDLDPAWQDAYASARRLFREVGAGQPFPREVAKQLAESVLSTELVRAAHAVAEAPSAAELRSAALRLAVLVETLAPDSAVDAVSALDDPA